MAKDNRTYIKLHDGMPENQKVVGLSDGAFRAYVEALCYCSRNLTDGNLTDAAMRRIAPQRVVSELVAAGLMDRANGRVAINDYLDHQRSKEHVENLKAARARAGGKGGRPRKPKPNGNQIGIPEQTKTESKTESQNNPNTELLLRSNQSEELLRSSQAEDGSDVLTPSVCIPKIDGVTTLSAVDHG